MLYILCRVGSMRLAVPVGAVIEVLPALRGRPTPGARPGYLGAIEHRGQAVPLLDLSRILGGPPAADRLSTRVLVVDAPRPDGPRRLALLVEGVTETRQIAEASFLPVEARLAARADAGLPQRAEVCFADDGAIYRLDLEILVAIDRTAAGSPLESRADPATAAPALPEETGDEGWRHAAA